MGKHSLTARAVVFQQIHPLALPVDVTVLKKPVFILFDAFRQVKF